MSDALDRIRQRTKPKVPPRDASLISLASQKIDIQTSRHTDVSSTESGEDSSSLDIQTLRHTDVPNPESHEDGSIYPPVLESRHIDIQTSKSLEDALPTKRSTFRLEVHLIDRLHTFSRRHGLSREVLIEAMYEYMEEHPEAMDHVVAQAKTKHDHRQQLANRKRAESMMSKFGGGQGL